LTIVVLSLPSGLRDVMQARGLGFDSQWGGQLFFNYYNLYYTASEW